MPPPRLGLVSPLCDAPTLALVTPAGLEPATSPAPQNKDALSPLSYSVVAIFTTVCGGAGAEEEGSAPTTTEQGEMPERRFPPPWTVEATPKRADQSFSLFIDIALPRGCHCLERARGLPRVPVVRTARALWRVVGVVASARAQPHCRSSNFGAYKDASPWEIWRVLRFPSCKLASQKTVSARSR